MNQPGFKSLSIDGPVASNSENRDTSPGYATYHLAPDNLRQAGQRAMGQGQGLGQNIQPAPNQMNLPILNNAVPFNGDVAMPRGNSNTSNGNPLAFNNVNSRAQRYPRQNNDPRTVMRMLIVLKSDQAPPAAVP